MNKRQSYLTGQRTAKPIKMRWLWIGLLLTLAAMTSLWFLGSAKTTAEPMEQVNVLVGDQPILVEVARTDAQRERGLMGRTHLNPGHGMLFLFPQPQPVSFWMKDTLIPLDILFFDSRGRLLNIAQAVPCPDTVAQCPTYPSHGEAGYVLELAAGEAQRLGIKPGHILQPNPQK